MRVLAAEREVILEVRDAYEELQYMQKKLNSSRSKIGVIEKHVAKEKAILDAGGEFTIDQLSFEGIKIPALKLAIESQQMELTQAKRQLAAQVGLADGSRIRVTDKLLRSNINLMGADLDYLTRMAFVHRGEGRHPQTRTGHRRIRTRYHKSPEDPMVQLRRGRLRQRQDRRSPHQ